MKTNDRPITEIMKAVDEGIIQLPDSSVVAYGTITVLGLWLQA
ncbi:hypothetical protein [Anaerotignum propionicum]|nr:hypothetical protein [Anaerotignum propionicum]